MLACKHTYLPPHLTSNSMPMASHLLILFLLTINHLLPTQSDQRFLLNLEKDHQTHQYTTELLMGTPQLPTKLVLHLSGHSLWLNCPPSSLSRNPIAYYSLQCLMAKSNAHKPSPTTCHVHQQNPITGETGVGDLNEDVVSVNGLTVDRFLFSCSPEYLVNGLVKGAKGVLGFGRSKIGLYSQIVNSFDFPRKFTVCLASSSSEQGFIISGTGTGTGIYKSLSHYYTPLVSMSSHGYYVNVNGIKINGRRLVVGQPLGVVEISTSVPYTVVKSSLYESLRKSFVSGASDMNMSLVAAVAPFGVCFRSQASSVPEIELVFQSELVKWKILARNSMVEVSDSVMCLGFVDGGLGMTGSMILGGYQLEDHMLEFDLGTGMMGFSSSLLKEGESCANIGATLRESL